MPDNFPEKAKDSLPFYPDHLMTEVKVMGGLLLLAVLVGAIGLVFPVGVGEPADPMNTPAHIKPEWYFLSLYQLLKFIPKTTGAVIPVMAVIVIALWPFIDRKPGVSRRSQVLRLVSVTFVVIVLTVLTIWGEVS